MRTKTFLLTSAILGLGLAGCSGPETPAIQDADVLATTVSSTLTAMPTLTPLPEATLPPIATEAPPQPTATSEIEPSPTTSPTVLPSETPALTSTVGPTGTLPPDDVRDSLGGATWRDDFSTGDNWPLGEDSFTSARVEGGELQLTGLTTTDGWRLTWPVVDDFYLEMTVATENCTSTDHYGLIVRVPDRSAADRGYLAGFSCNGRYSLRAWDGETMTNLLPPTASEAILAGAEQENRIGLRAKGKQLGLYANGMLLRQIEDDTFLDEGSFGIWVGARQTENFTISVDEIAYWDNP